MNKSQLDTLLKQTAPRASLLYGDGFMVGYYGKKIAHALQCEEKNTFYFDDYNTISVNTLLSQGSLFGTSSLVVVKVNHKLPKSDIELFLQSLLTNTHNALIVEYYQAQNKSLSEYMRDCKAVAGYFTQAKMPKNSVIETRFFEPNMAECMELLRMKSKELQLNIHDRILHQILSIQNNDIALALNELEKFVLYKHRAIEIDDVNMLCHGMGSFSIEELCCAIMDKTPFLHILHNIYEEGANEIAMIAEIQRFFYQLFLCFAYAKIHGTINAREILGYMPPAHIIERLSRYCIRFKETEYMRIFELLSQWRYEVSTGRAKQSMFALIKIQALLR